LQLGLHNPPLSQGTAPWQGKGMGSKRRIWEGGQREGGGKQKEAGQNWKERKGQEGKIGNGRGENGRECPRPVFLANCWQPYMIHS